MQKVLIFIRPESDHWLPLSLTPSFTPSCLVDLIDMSLACEDASSKLVEVVTAAAAAAVDTGWWNSEQDLCKNL